MVFSLRMGSRARPVGIVGRELEGTMRNWIGRMISGIGIGLAITAWADSVGAFSVTRPCTIEESGGACLFDLTTNAAGKLSACTTAGTAGQSWRASLFQVNADGAVSRVSAGTTVPCSNPVSRDVTGAVKYIAAITYDGPLTGSYPKTVQVTIAAPTTSISGPRKCYPSDNVTTCTTDPQSVCCGFDLSCDLTVGDLDTYRFSAPANAAVAIKICGDSYNYWTIYDPQGKQLKYSYGYDALTLGSLSGTYSIQTKNGLNRAGPYSLSMQGVSDIYRCAQPIVDGGSPLTSTLSSCADIDGYTFQGRTGQVYTITVTGDSYNIWYLYDPAGTYLKYCYGSCQTAPLSKNGGYTIVVSNGLDRLGTYTLSLNKISGAAATAAARPAEQLPETILTGDEQPPAAE